MILVDLNGTLAHYVRGQPHGYIGPPIRDMAVRVRRWVQRGEEVRVLTARVADPDDAPAYAKRIRLWTRDRLGTALESCADRPEGTTAVWDDKVWPVHDGKFVVKPPIWTVEGESPIAFASPGVPESFIKGGREHNWQVVRWGPGVPKTSRVLQVWDTVGVRVERNTGRIIAEARSS